MNINYFELFELEEVFNINEVLLEKKYDQLMLKYHPDRYVNKSDIERKEVALISATINDAYQTLKFPLKRISYILKLHNIDLNNQERTSFTNDLLIEQMKLREELEDINTIDNIKIFEKEILNYNNNIINQIANLIDNEDYPNAQNTAYKLMFIDKLLKSINEKKSLLSII